MPDPAGYWFPAKKYGWGWGLPRVWQGWVVLGLFAALVGFGAVAILPHGRPAFIVYCLVLCAGLLLVCRVKGEPPRWRWGKE